MFDRISSRYDLLNNVMSLGRHHIWRRIAVDLVLGPIQGPALDVAAGTGDFTVELASRSQISYVIGLDFSTEMIRQGRHKVAHRGLDKSVDYTIGDAHALPFQDNHFACVTVGFGIRNFVDVQSALTELSRVLRPGGRVSVLEIVRITRGGPFAKLFMICFRYLTPWLGILLAGERDAYTYLPESVQGFLSAYVLADLMRDAGFKNVAVRNLAFGSVTIIVGETR